MDPPVDAAEMRAAALTGEDITSVAPSMQGITNAAIATEGSDHVAPHIERAYRSSECRTPLIVIHADLDPMPSLVCLAKRQGCGVWNIVTDSRKSERNAIDYVDVGIRNGDWVVLTQVEKASTAVLRHIGVMLMTLEPEPRLYPRRAFFRLWIIAEQPFDVDDWITPLLPQVLMHNALVARTSTNPAGVPRLRRHASPEGKYDAIDVSHHHDDDAHTAVQKTQMNVPHKDEAVAMEDPHNTKNTTAERGIPYMGCDDNDAGGSPKKANEPAVAAQHHSCTTPPRQGVHDDHHLMDEGGTSPASGGSPTTTTTKHKLQRRFPSEPPLVVEEVRRRRQRKRCGRDSDSESDREAPEEKPTGLWFHRAVDFFSADVSSSGAKSSEGIFPAVDREDAVMIREVAHSGHINIDTIRREGMNPLMYAVSRERVRSAQALVECGADVQVTREVDHCPLLFMSITNPDLLQVLVDGGADVYRRFEGYRLEDHASTHPHIAQIVREMKGAPKGRHHRMQVGSASLT